MADEKILYEIINPSDAYTIEAVGLDVAATACFLLGRGRYAFIALTKDAPSVPIMMFDGGDGWSGETFGKPMSNVCGEVLKSKRAELIACFESCLIGHERDRQEYARARELIGDKDKVALFRLERHDKRRSSLNDIGGRADEYAKRLKEKANEA